MKELGINLVQIISYVLIFLLLYVFTKRFLNIFFKNLEIRRKQIQEGIENAQKANEILEIRTKEAEKEYEKIIKQAFKESEEIIESAKKRSKEIITEAEIQGKNILEEAKADIKNAQQRAREEGLQEARDIILAIAQKAFEGIKLTKEQEEELIRISLEKIHD